MAAAAAQLPKEAVAPSEAAWRATLWTLGSFLLPSRLQRGGELCGFAPILLLAGGCCCCCEEQRAANGQWLKEMLLLLLRNLCVL